MSMTMDQYSPVGKSNQNSEIDSYTHSLSRRESYSSVKYSFIVLFTGTAIFNFFFLLVCNKAEFCPTSTVSMQIQTMLSNNII